MGSGFVRQHQAQTSGQGVSGCRAAILPRAGQQQTMVGFPYVQVSLDMTSLLVLPYFCAALKAMPSPLQGSAPSPFKAERNFVPSLPLQLPLPPVVSCIWELETW